MITTDTVDYDYRKQKFLEYKDTLEKVPTDPDAKKEYYVGCHSAEDWQYIHEVLMQDGTCLLYTSPSPRDQRGSRMPSSA